MKTLESESEFVNALFERLETANVSFQVLVDFIEELERVKHNGWGSVVATVQRGELTTIEGKTTKLYAVSRYEKHE